MAYAFRLCLSRNPTQQEIQRLSMLFYDVSKRYAQQKEEAVKLATDPIGPLPDGANPAEVAAWTVVANVLLNLDEFLARR
ncbi:MAG: hypothetical protein KatS3mg105_3333 [Gemmatales bacterium]|nr:MAG: hypothetical protein KatS3mg105_3333 [Gemmatales bacterium]